MNEVIHKVPLKEASEDGSDPLVSREWLVTNGLGGYASGTISGVLTRRFHGMLVASLPAPFGRMMMLNKVSERVHLSDGSTIRLDGEDHIDKSLNLYDAKYLTGFRLEMGLPVWRYEIEGTILEKRVLLPYKQNTVYITYTMLAGDGKIRLELHPAVQFRPHEGRLDVKTQKPYRLAIVEDRYELSSDAQLPSLRMQIYSKQEAFTFSRKHIRDLCYQREQSRGYDYTGDLWSPGYFHAELSEGSAATLVASTEEWETIHAMPPSEAFDSECERRRQLLSAAHVKAQEGTAAELVFAADQFLITPAGRVEDAARAHASGEELRSVIAGYHWFTDWGRDTMISLEGLTLVTGRQKEANWILRTFAHYIRDGLIPNMFPEGEKQGLYHTADATLWFFHAMSRYVASTGDRETLRVLLPRLIEIIDHHLKGTRFGIKVDPSDGLLTQGEEGYQLTWMDAKVGDWVVTPRRGKAVEINALWYNALRCVEEWVREAQNEDKARPFAEHADRVLRSFNERFWYEEGGYLYDLIDGEHGDDPALRPNQIFALSLPYAILDREHWEPVVEIVRKQLLTPVGLRSLAPGHADYKSTYDGDLHARDAAYHQGTVWGWLIGPFIDAWLKLHPEDIKGAREMLEGFVPHLDEFGVGSIAEIFDAEPPYHPRGCIAQAWSIAEVLRCWVKTTTEG